MQIAKVIRVGYDENEKKFLLSVIDEALERRRVGYGEQDVGEVEKLERLRERLEKAR